jgi:RHS repeat-associated protein
MTSNPYTSSAQYWTTSQFDVLGRATQTVLQDSSATTFSYAANAATITDPAGKARKSVADGLGRMTSVYEPDPNNGNSLTVQTSYAYNILDQLTGVTEGSQTRTYVYDDLGRVNKTTTPEGGTTCFGTYSGSTCQTNGYDSFGDLLYRTDARGVLTSYTYDNLNRLSTISYNVGTSGVTPTPGLTLTYDQGGSAAYALGRLTSMTDGVGSETYAYNNLGEMTQLQKIIGTTTYTTGYAYNLAGELSSITYPSTRVVQQNFDTIGRLCAVGTSGSTCSSGTTYATGFAYNAAFQVTGFNYGNGVAAAFGYTPDRLLLQSLAYTKGSSTLFSTNYWYKTDATNCPNGASGNNGQIQCITDNVDSGRTISYGFDSLYRITAATTNGSSNYTKWGLQWTYDRYGNRLSQSQTYDAPPTNSVTVSATTNQITGSPYAYDANGNMTNDGNNTLVYDAENRVLSATNGGSSGTYTYDGNSLRVKKASGSTTTLYIFSGTKVIAEYDNGAAPASPSREYIYSASKLLAKIDSTGTKYYHEDHLSNRLVTDSSGNALEQLGHYPFGESWYNASNDKLLFASYERDAESGNDYAMMRSYVNRLGRYSSSDPLNGSANSPQSLNRYTYVRNDPGNLIDPQGLSPKVNVVGLDPSAWWNAWAFEVLLNGAQAAADALPQNYLVGYQDINGEPVPIWNTVYPENQNLGVLNLGFPQNGTGQAPPPLPINPPQPPQPPTPKPYNLIICGSIRDDYTRGVNAVMANDWLNVYSGFLLGGWFSGAKGAVVGAVPGVIGSVTSNDKINQITNASNAAWRSAGCPGNVQNGQGLLDMPTPDPFF